MIISVNWLRQFTQIDASVDELATVIGSRLVEIEGVSDIGQKYAGVVIARIVDARPVEDSDHLNLTRIDDAGVTPDVERDSDGYVQVVCGAPNVREGMLVAWLPPGSTVPDSFGTDEPFVLSARKLRGYVSNGMLASARELALFDDHEGIVDIDKDVAPGTPFRDAYALDDQLLDIENKSLTHRPDTFGIVGFAREVAAIAGRGFETPDWLLELAPAIDPSGETYPLTSTIDGTGLSRRYSAVVVDGVDKAARTPFEIQTYLARSGVRPISPIVDITNYLMLLTGQPLHAFDYDKVVAVAGSADLYVRSGRDGESLTLLDGRTISMTAGDIVVAAGPAKSSVAIALAGAMGGANTEIDDDTKTIIIESATFDLYKLRATQMRHGIFSEAITRFTKGQPPELALPVLAQAARMIKEIANGRVASHLTDSFPVPTVQPTLTLTLDRINGLLGSRFAVADVIETLRNVEFLAENERGSKEPETITVTPPYWRTDIHSDEDVIEEVGRLNGFDSIEPVLPLRPFTAIAPSDFDVFRAKVRRILSTAGSNEVLTYSFVHSDLLTKAGQTPSNAYSLANAISPDLQYYRLSLTPSLLAAVTPNIRQKYGEFALYEIGKAHSRLRPDTDEPDLPAEAERLGFVYAADTKNAAGRASAYYTAKYYLQYLLKRLNVTRPVTYTELEADDLSAPFEPKRAARVMLGDQSLGVIGEYGVSVTDALKLPEYAAGFELDLAVLFKAASVIAKYEPVGRYQGSDADVTFAVGTDVAYATIEVAARETLDDSGYRYVLTPGDIYAPKAGTKNVTLHIELSSDQKTLSRDDVNAVVSAINDRVGAVIAE